jgi:hypothetical protein
MRDPSGKALFNSATSMNGHLVGRRRRLLAAREQIQRRAGTSIS